MSLLLLSCLAMAGGPDSQPIPFAQLGVGLPPARIPFRFFGIEQGLESLVVTSLTQDRDGFLWVGTANGLYRYDGKHFQRFSLDDGLPGRMVFSLACASEGTLWLGTDQGLAYLHQGRIRCAAGEIGRVAVNALAMAPGGQVWVGTNQGVFLGSRETGFTAVPDWHFGSVQALLVAGDALWVGSETGLVVRLPGCRWKRWEREQGLGEEGIVALALDGQSRFWARTASHLWMRPSNGSSFTAVRKFNKEGFSRRGASLLSDRLGRLWVPSKDRVEILDGDRWSIITLKQGLPTSLAYSLYQDTEGSIWIGGIGGLYQLLGRENWTFYNTQSGLPSNIVWSIRRDRSGTMWAATHQGIARAAPAGWKILHGTERTLISCMAELPSGHLVASGIPTVLFEWDPKSLSVIRHPLPVRQGDRCLAMGLDRRGSLWICMQSSGVFVGEKTGTTWVFRPVSLPESPFGEEFMDLEADSEGGIWVITQSALFHFDEQGCRRYTTRDGVLPNPFTLGRFAKGEMFLSSRSTNGWIRFRQGREGMEILEKHEGGERRQRDPIYATCMDARGRIWLGGGLGVEVRDHGNITRFTSGDGLVWCDVSNKAMLAEPSGEIWIGTSGGLAHYREKAMDLGPLPPITRIFEATLGEQRLDLYGSKEIVVPSSQNNLHVQFSSPGLANPRWQIQTRLVGLDPVWRPSEALTLNIPGLGAGNYRFEARARYEGGGWGSCATLAFRVRPPWWMTWPARLVELLLACVGIWGMVRYRTHRLAVHNRTLHEQVTDATREIVEHERQLELKAQELVRVNVELEGLNEQQKHFLGMAAHDLRNPLTTIVVAAEMMSREKDLEEISRKAQMIREESLGMSALVGRFLDIAALDTGKVHVESEEVSLAEVVDWVKCHHQGHAESKRIALLTVLPPSGHIVYADPRLVQEILDNLVSNAIKFSPPGSCVTLRVEPRGSTVICSVEDQGPGLSAEDRSRLFERYAVLSAKPTGGEKSTGLGLSIVKHLVELQEARIWVDSELGCGATFFVELPAARNEADGRIV